MKDDVAFALLLIAAFGGVVVVAGMSEPPAAVAQATGPLRQANAKEAEIRYIEPVTVIGYRDPPMERPNNLAIANPDQHVPNKAP